MRCAILNLSKFARTVVSVVTALVLGRSLWRTRAPSRGRERHPWCGDHPTDSHSVSVVLSALDMRSTYESPERAIRSQYGGISLNSISTGSSNSKWKILRSTPKPNSTRMPLRGGRTSFRRQALQQPRALGFKPRTHPSLVCRMWSRCLELSPASTGSIPHEI